MAFDRESLTRREHVENVKKRDVFKKYGEQAKAVLNTLLDKHADDGVMSLNDTNVLLIASFSELGTSLQRVKAFGGKVEFFEGGTGNAGRAL
ncbi:type I restriction-modification enzyme R subunit C-terminal domain-containing protein [Alphaproteobacteria bacterium]|nr:type I restriction-modification enzyme R subunit C-terminal domain-containing protein [Alphaproteobacteria bacterium]